jgi:peptidoglycan hydrolase FlgJ
MLNNIDAIGPQQPDQANGEDKVAPAVDTAAADKAYVAKATKAAVEFESFFISHMLHQMRESTRAIAPEDSPTRDRVNQDMTDMVDNMLAGNMAQQRAFGVADAILRQILPAPLNKSS